MDSVTQAVLGASIAGAIAPKGHRKRAIVAGAVLGTLPDLDVFFTHQTAIDDFTKHRGWSHSLFILSAIAIVLTPLSKKIFREIPLWQAFLIVLLPLVTHPMLDALTSYGTQLFYPIPVTPTYFASIFIIDPLYTIWLILGVSIYLLNEKFKWINYTGLLISSVYLVIGLVMQQVALKQLLAAYPDTQKSEWFVAAVGGSPFCWRGINVKNNQKDAEYIETIFNVQNPEFMAEQRYEILDSTFYPQSKDWEQITWFNPKTVLRNSGLENNDEKFISSDLRMGEFGQYFFQFSYDKDGVNHSKSKFKFSEKRWNPKSQNQLADKYINSNIGESRELKKIKQMGRCIMGDI